MTRNEPSPDLIVGNDPDPAVEAAITRALQRKPSPAVPPGFSARVARLATAQPLPLAPRWIGWGPRLAIASGALITCAMFALAPHLTPTLTDFRFDAELVLFAELSTLLLFSNRLLNRD